jgi:hypothetical protein
MKKLPFISILLAISLTSCTNAFPFSYSFLSRDIPVSYPQNSGDKNSPIAKAEEQTVLLFTIGMHIEPMGVTHQGIKSGKGDYSNNEFFKLQVQNIRKVVEIVNKHKGKMTIQTQSPFTDEVIKNNDPVLSDLAAAGNEIALHFHEDAHLGKNSTGKTVNQWCSVMNEEINIVKQASGVQIIRYWSGGNIYPDIFDAAKCAGLTVNSDWKNPQTQSTDASIIGIHPWRPAGGTDGSNFELISQNDPSGPVIFLPEGKYDKENFASMRRSEDTGGDEAYFEYLEKSLMASLEAAESGKVNVFHFTVHPNEFRGTPAHPYAVIESFLTDVVDPLVASGKVRWATFSNMADAYQLWEQSHPNQDMRD